PTISGGNTTGVFHIRTEAQSVTLAHLRIVNAKGAIHGAIYNGADLALNSVILAGNTTRGDGGGIRNDRALTMTNVVFDHNSADYLGGGLSNIGLVSAWGVTFTANSAPKGGAILNLWVSYSGDSGKLTLTDVAFS